MGPKVGHNFLRHHDKETKIFRSLISTGNIKKSSYLQLRILVSRLELRDTKLSLYFL